MLEREVYLFMLDLFPLTDVLVDKDGSLSALLRSKSLDLLLAAQAGFPCKNLLLQIETLVKLSGDLGYIDEEVNKFLLDGINRMAQDNWE